MARTRMLFLLAAALIGLLGALAFLYHGRSGSIPVPSRVEAAEAAQVAVPIEGLPESLDLTSVAAATRKSLPSPVAWNSGTGPVQLAGRVVDERGVPLAGASVTVAELGADKPEVLSCTTDTEGRFEARGSWASPEVIARAMHPECWNAANCRVERGTAAVELALQHGARLQGRFALERVEPLPDMMFALINLETKSNAGAWLPFRSRPEDVAGRGPGTVECSPDGRFDVRGLRPGHYSIQVLASGVSNAVASIADIELRAGEIWSGETCNPLLLHMPAPVEIDFEIAEVSGLGRGDRLRVYFDPWTGAERPSSDRWGQRGTRLRKDGGGVVTIHSAGAPDLPGAELLPGQLTRVRLPSAGKFGVLLFLARESADGEGEMLLELDAISPKWIEVQDAVVQPGFRIHLDEARLAALLASLER